MQEDRHPPRLVERPFGRQQARWAGLADGWVRDQGCFGHCRSRGAEPTVANAGFEGAAQIDRYSAVARGGQGQSLTMTSDSPRGVILSFSSDHGDTFVQLTLHEVR